MKKRIGTILYNTETALLLIPEKNLYRTQRKQTYFLFDGQTITPVSYQEAEKMIHETDNPDLEKFLKRVPNNKGLTGIFISAASADKLSAYCRRHKTSQKKVVEDLIDTLPDD